MRDRLIRLLCSVKCEGADRREGGCPRRVDDECANIYKLEMCMIETIADHLLANGVIVPPCKVGDTVYVIVVKQPCYACVACTGFCHKDCRFDDKSKMVIKRATVHEICCSNGINKIRVEVEEDKNTYSYDQTFWFDDFGKTVFLTREEAEQALKGGASDG